MSTRCERCTALSAELTALGVRNKQLEHEAKQLHAQLRETVKLVELQKADLERYRAAYERVQPNTPERVPTNQLQLAFERVLLALQDVPATKAVAAAAKASGTAEKKEKRKQGPHGRRRLELTSLPVERVEMDPDEVVAAGGEGFEQIGEEVSERVAFKRGGFVRLRIVRRKWARVTEKAAVESNVVELRKVVVAPLPDSVWPNTMAEPSAVAQNIIAKYDDSLPLHRQERISARNGFTVPRSTQCGWLGAAYAMVYRVVEAMLAEAKATAFCIALDATGAPVRAPGECEDWHIFVLLADREHVVFQYMQHQTSTAIEAMLEGYRGHLLLDAAPVYDALFGGGDRVEVACWFHQRRYFWRALETQKELALEALSLIAKLFDIERRMKVLPVSEKTVARADAARPVLAMLDAWVARNRDKADPRGPLAQAIGYYDNQREALHQFLTDGRLRLDNSVSEQQLRNVALGRHNWTFFENETGLRWYCAFRSLIASCALHGINAHEYLEQLLRLAPSWPVARVLELAPKYWKGTLAKLDARQRATLERPWERTWPTVISPTPSTSAAA